MANALNLDRLRRMQATLLRRIAVRDPDNIQAIGFAPHDPGKPGSSPRSLIAQVDVTQKRKRVSEAKRVPRIEPVRLLDRRQREYDTLELATDVNQTGSVQPTAVPIRAGTTMTATVTATTPRATVAVVVRWTTADSITSPNADDPHDPRWRWGILTVSHLFSGFSGAAESTGRPMGNIDRVVTCGSGPAIIPGRVNVRGRIPGGPDLALVETGLDRVWLSGFLADPAGPKFEPAGEAQLVRWTESGATGEHFSYRLRSGKANSNNRASESVVTQWRWLTFYPRWSLPELGRLEQVVRYELIGDTGQRKPFGPGTSGSLLVSGGLPVGLQIAAEGPDFTIGYAQTLHASLAWLKSRLAAKQLGIVSIIDN
jgi:hypothetical protein